MKWLVGTVIVLLLAGATALLLNVRQQNHEVEQRAAWLTGGRPEHGRELSERYGCGSCHTIPGVRGARGMAGPSLLRFGQRTFIAGQRRNTPQNLIPWLQHPQHIEPNTAMPEMGVTDADARDIAAYLYTLR
jgi:cytochrome c1